MANRRRRFTGLLTAVLVLLGMSLMTGTAQASQATSAAGANAAPTKAGGDGATGAGDKDPNKPAKQQKKARAHYTPTGCNKLSTKQRRHHQARCYSVVYTPEDHTIQGNAAQPPATALGPEDIQSAYDLPDAGAGQTVAIVDAYGYSTAEEDLAEFRDHYGLPPCTSDNGCFTKVDQDGGTDYPADDPGWALETALDLDAVSAACPKCHLLLVEGDDAGFDSLGTAVDTAVDLGAKFVSNSYGVDGEDPAQLSYDHYYSHEGVAVTVSSGDTGNVQSWPATNPDVVAVGGTKLTEDSSSRGWQESAWVDAGSGCSLYEDKPGYQDDVDTACDKRANADVSADADPATGLAVYDTLGQDGWLQVGGTSLSSPLMAGMYALAGTPAPGTFPVTYPYSEPGGLNDVTEGSNGGCGNVLCESGPGWDGPTGLGTPNGVESLTTEPHGDIAGEVTDADGGAPIEGATVSTADGHSDTTDADGSYDLSVPTGSYDLTATAFGYDSASQDGVEVTEGETTTADFALAAVPSHTVSGNVTDGSGQDWPLYAEITVDGFSHQSTFTNPYSGRYHLDLPEGSDYTLHVQAKYPGYEDTDVTVQVGSENVHKNIDVPVDADACTAPGYSYSYDGATQDFAGWTDTTAQDGWTNVDNTDSGQIWTFDNPGGRTPPPGGDEDFAIIDSDDYGIGNSQDTSLVSPVVDMSDQTSPEIGFDTNYKSYSSSVADVDMSLDGGDTWDTVWNRTTTDVQDHVDIPVDAAAGEPDVQVRFHYTGSWAYYWGVDNVFLGNRTCAPTEGGLVAGIVRDHNTGSPIDGAKVASESVPTEFAISAPTPDDPRLRDGFYWLFSSATGRTKFTASKGKYEPLTRTITVDAGYVVHKNWSLRAGHLTVSKHGIAVTEQMGVSKTRRVTFGNDGTEPIHVKLSERDAGFTPKAGKHMAKTPGPPVKHVKGRFSTHAPTHRLKPGAEVDGDEPRLRMPTPAAPPWTDIADYPETVMDNALAYHDGAAYSVGGSDGTTTKDTAYAYDPADKAWDQIADLPEPLNAPAAAFVGDTLYVAGGWADSGSATGHVYAYDPSADSWTQAADMPTAVSAAGAAVVDGKLYVVGGCTTSQCTPASAAVQAYDPGSDSWSAAPDYPKAVAFTACAGVPGEVVCAGGNEADTNTSLTETYVLAPGSDWTQVADMPVDAWAASAAGVGGKLQVAGGAINNSAEVTNQVFEYDPAGDDWTALANSNNAVYRGGGSCGMYKVGGSTGGFNPVPFAERFPGYDDCGGGADVPWLSEDPTEFDVAPGQSVVVRVRMDSSVVDQPGDYMAELAMATDTPYRVDPVEATMHAVQPSSWGKVAGTVTEDATGDPISGATVQICTMWDQDYGCGPVTYTLKTDADGKYQLWLNQGYDPLQVIAAKDGYQPKAKVVRVRAGETTTAGFRLKEN